MKLAISNLAWEHNEKDEVVILMQKYNINAVEIAISKSFPDFLHISNKNLTDLRSFWNRNGINIIALTHLISPLPELTLFDNKVTRLKTLEYLMKQIETASVLGAKVMNFGSPKNRRLGKISKKEAYTIAQEFFNEIAERCQKYGIYFAFEPNPIIYGTDFINTTPEAVDLIRRVNHPNFGINIDLSTMTENKEDYARTIKMVNDFAWHFHISEPGLVPIPLSTTNHRAVVEVLNNVGYDKYVSIEMKLGENVNRLLEIEKSLSCVKSIYN